MKNYDFEKIPLPTVDILEKVLSNYIGNPSEYLISLINQTEYSEPLKVFATDFFEVPEGFEIQDSNTHKPASKVVCYEPISNTENSNTEKGGVQKVFDSLIPGGQAVFVLSTAFMTEPEKVNEQKGKKLMLNKGGFIVERMIESMEEDLVVECRKPLTLERILKKEEHSTRRLLIKEVQNDKEARDYYNVTSEYFDLLARWIDMSFDQQSALFVLYYQVWDEKGNKIVEKPIGATRVVPNFKIKLPIEYGFVVGAGVNESEGKGNERVHFSVSEVRDVPSAEVSHLAFTSDKRLKEELNLSSIRDVWSIKEKGLTMLFSAALNYCISKRIKDVYLSYDKNNRGLGNLYKKIGFVPVGKEIYYEGNEDSHYVIMRMDLEEAITRAVRENDLFKLNLIKSALLNPTKVFIEIHEQVFDKVPAYKGMYNTIIEMLKQGEEYSGHKEPDTNKSKRELVVMDIPVTTGNMSRLLSEMYNNIIGVDISQDSLDLGEKKALQQNNRVKYTKIIADATQKLPLQDNSVDRLVCTNLLYALPNPDNLVKELYRVLKKGGFGVITNFNRNILLPEDEFMKKVRTCEDCGASVENIDFWKKSNDFLNTLSGFYKESHFDKDELQSVLQDSGFEIIDFKEVFLGNAYTVLVKKQE